MTAHEKTCRKHALDKAESPASTCQARTAFMRNPILTPIHCHKMKPENIRQIFFVIALVFFVQGCGPSRPAGIPKLYPAIITVTNSNSPIEDVLVVLVEEGQTRGSWATSGYTDSHGHAKIETLQGAWKSPGVPEGTYIVYLSKMTKLIMTPPPGTEGNPELEEKFALEYARKKASLPQEIPEVLSDINKTPIRITIASEAPASLTIDVAEYEEKKN